MPVPKKRKTRSAKGQRRSHQALSKVLLFPCPKCAEPIIPHTVCQKCGQYREKQIIDVEAREEKKRKKEKKRLKAKTKESQ